MEGLRHILHLLQQVRAHYRLKLYTSLLVKIDTHTFWIRNSYGSKFTPGSNLAFEGSNQRSKACHKYLEYFFFQFFSLLYTVYICNLIRYEIRRNI